MAITGFGVTELNLIGSSGTPKIESPNNINLNAVTVAISTNATVGGTLDVDGHTELDGVNVVGVCTATTFVGNISGAGVTASSVNAATESGDANCFPLFIKELGGEESPKVSNKLFYDSITGQLSATRLVANTDGLVVTGGGANITGICTATGFRSSTTTGNGSDVAFAIKYYITSNGASAYRFAGAGSLNTDDNPTLYFHRGFTYILENSTGGSHPFELRTTSGGSAYAPGGSFLTGSTTGTQILTVPYDAPATIVYQCTIHGGMVGTINFVQ